MNYTLCLDPYSVNFNSSQLSGNGFAIYTDADNFVSPIAVNLPASSIFSSPLGNCSITLTNIPNNATQILVVDQCDGPPPSTPGSPDTPSYTCCYALLTIPEGCIPWCDECGIGFDTFQTSSIGKIVAGNLISSCGTVTDYVIGWYLNGDYSAPALTTGFGSAAGPYQFGPHPLTGSGAVPVVSGDWEGIIHDVVINGITYSSISGSAGGTLIPFESCFGTFIIDPLTCDNGPYVTSSKYSHQYNFNSQAVGTTPAPTSLTYILDPTTKYFAYAFRALSVWDELEIKWISGDPNATSNPSLYSQPIYLEKIQLGSNVNIPLPTTSPLSTLPLFPNNYILGTTLLSSATPPTVSNVWPKKSTHDYYFQRVLTLTNLETSSNPAAPDSLEITVTPNPTNNNTRWEAGFQCLTDFDCTNCFLEDYPDSLPSIWKIELKKQYGCAKQRMVLHISGCKTVETSDWAGVSINTGNYNLSTPNINLINSGIQLGTNGPFHVPWPWTGNGNWINLSGFSSCTIGNTPANLTCSPPSTNTITLNKTPNQIQLTFDNYNDYLHYKNNIINVFNSMGISSPVPCNSNTLGILPYYQYFQLYVPFQAPTVNCGDNSTTLQYNFSVNDYFNIQYVENVSSNFWSITIPQTSMVNCSPTGLGQCDSCFNTIQSFINTYNSSIFPSFSFTTNVGAKFVTPVSKRWVSKNSSGGASGSYCYTSYSFFQSIPYYSINTIPFISSSQSTTGWVNLPSLGASLSCSLLPYPIATNGTAFGGSYYARFNSYQVRFPSLTGSFDYSLSTNDFEIHALSNFGPTGSINETPNVSPLPCPDPKGALIYSYIGGVATVYTSSHFWQGNNPILVIDP
jgi:hypothetical protein